MVKQTEHSVARRLVLGALRSLTSGDGFKALLQRTKPAQRTSQSYARAAFAECRATLGTMPDSAVSVLDATVIVDAGKSFGSGFFLSDGLVLTAEHVVRSSELTIKTRDGRSLRARLLRANPRFDSALLAVDGARSGPCLPVDRAPKAPGREVYAVGSPASQKLAFSLTRGIVSESGISTE